ncbi:hypothetical protein SMAC4_13614 [Sordaria macrospora]|nr:hypothetical protein SMAC4_13614 [Sordaria macrospora]
MSSSPGYRFGTFSDHPTQSGPLSLLTWRSSVLPSL